MSAIFVSDFDRTLTTNEFYALACLEFPELSLEKYWEKFEQGEMTHFEALRTIFKQIKSEEKILAILEKMDLVANLAESVERLAKNNWELIIVSAGCSWYIDKLLKNQNVKVQVYANPGTFSPQNGLQMVLPEKSPFFSREVGVDKAAIVRDSLRKSSRVAFAGDGRPDLPAALLVPPKRRFAKLWLADKLTEMGEEFHPFNHWTEIVDVLVHEEVGSYVKK